MQLNNIIYMLNKIKENKYYTNKNKNKYQIQAYNNVIKYMNQNYDSSEKIDKYKIEKMNITNNMKNKLLLILKNDTSKLNRIIKINNNKYSRIYLKPLINDIKKNNRNIKITGSYRRKNKYMNDIDMILIIKNKNNIQKDINRIVNHFKIKYKAEILTDININSRMIKINMNHKNNKIKFDIFVCHKWKNEYIPMLIHTTGPKSFNIKTRKLLKNKYKINQYRIIDKKKGTIINLKYEKDFFEKILNINYLPPEKRNSY